MQLTPVDEFLDRAFSLQFKLAKKPTQATVQTVGWQETSTWSALSELTFGLWFVCEHQRCFKSSPAQAEQELESWLVNYGWRQSA